LNRAKIKHQANTYHPAPPPPNGTIDASWVSAVGDDSDLAPGTFLQTYKSILFLCAISGMFCASAIIYLGHSVLHLGIVGVPFLVIFAAGLALSIGLPFKMLKEHAVITRG
jgi:hypothetical protein